MFIHLSRAFVSMVKSSKRLAGRSWTEELMTRTLRRVFDESIEQENGYLNKQLSQMPPLHFSLAKVATELIEVAGVPCMKLQPNGVKRIKCVIVYLHGGGYVAGSPKIYKSLLAQLAVNSSATLIAADYRLAPDHPYPAAFNDCLAAVKQVLTANDDLPVVIAGDSAGGALSTATVLELSNQPETPKPAGLVLISPWVDPMANKGSIINNDHHDIFSLTSLVESYASYIGSADPNNHHCSFTNVDLGSLPKTYVQYAGGELFVDQINEFCDRATAQGVDIQVELFKSQAHVFQTLSPLTRVARQAVKKISGFINGL